MKALDDVFQLLDRKRRRFALYYLREAQRPVSVDELAATIAEWEADSAVAADEFVDFDDVVLTLKHQHLPKAARTEFVEYDPEESVVRMTGSPPEFSVILSVARAIEQPEGDDILRLGDRI